ncbi:hypothetical protein [Streptomyces sp. NPDC006996]|uniref:hypothetical protein n=1 Tax=Streptomyces sp. NPDC006996 TaxID=3156908 RepID=UPI0033F8762F
MLVVGFVAVRFAVAFRELRESPTVGVGRVITAWFRSTPRGFGSAPFQSRARGVGSCAATAESVRSPSEPRWFGPPFSPSLAFGVGRAGEDEQALTLVGGSHIGRSYSRPFRIEPERGKIGEDVGKPKSNMP